MTVAGSAPLVVASNRGPISIVPVEDGDDEIRRGGAASLWDAGLTLRNARRRLDMLRPQ
jgi:hypothetical protein